ncbi:MAG: FGGY family carbohydrate kinase [Candidatus Caldatribacteriaceae bacterium]
MALLTYDVGTSAVKVVLFSSQGELLSSASHPLQTHVVGKKVTQNPNDWWKGFLVGTRTCLRELREEELAIIGTGQMEDLVLLDAEGNPLGEASLYSDSDIGHYSLPETLRERLEKQIPNRLDDFTPLVKVLALPSYLLERVQFFILGAKDYVNFRLTGKSFTDPTNASTTGFFDMHTFQWTKEVESFQKLLPSLAWPTEVIGEVKPEIVPLLGVKGNQRIPVFNGIGDLGAVTMGAGVISPNESYCYLGTTGWLARLSEGVSANRDLFSLPFWKQGEWVVVAPLLNVGNVYQWSLKTFLGKEDYQEGERILAQYLNTPIQVWPYLNGERVPYRNEHVRSVMTRVNEGANPPELFAAFARSLLFAIRHAHDALGVDNLVLRLIGGLTKQKTWVQLLADVLKKPCQVIRGESYAPQRGLYTLFLLSQGSQPPKVDIEEIYYPRSNNFLERLYQEYRGFAEKLLRGEKDIPAYL